MSRRVLIAFGSKHGSTADTAERVGEMLRERGLEVEVVEAGRVTSVDEYDAFVVGGSIYAGRWNPDSKAFTQRFAAQLATGPVAYFALGPKTSDPEDLESARQQLARYRLEPLTVFGGVIDPAKLHFPFSRMEPSDARDWETVRDFADAFAARVAVPETV